jgi:hypothetical protein
MEKCYARIIMIKNIVVTDQLLTFARMEKL